MAAPGGTWGTFVPAVTLFSTPINTPDPSTAAVDNIDHNPSSTTATQSFHGTAISLMQHPAFPGAGIDRIMGGPNARGKAVDRLPHYYTDVPSVTGSIKNTPVPPTTMTSLSSNSSRFKQHADEEHRWLEHTQLNLQEHSAENTSWAAYHASRQNMSSGRPVCPTALLPLFLKSALTVAMIKHSMDVIWNAVQHLNPGQTPVVTFDQPLCALAKQIQWKWSQDYGEQKFVVFFGGLHIEMATLKTLGNWLQGSRWVQALVQAEITSAGTADSILWASHVSQTRRAHQVTAAALSILQRRAYDHYLQLSDERNGELEFDDWYQQKAKMCSQFDYWATVLLLELTVLVYVRSLRR